MYSINYACEKSVVDFLTNNTPTITASFYTGIGQVEDLKAPCVIVNCHQGNELYKNSNVYELNVNIQTKEMVADITDMGKLIYLIQNAFATGSRVSKINTNNSNSFVCMDMQQTDITNTVSGDALMSELSVRVIGSLSGSVQI